MTLRPAGDLVRAASFAANAAGPGRAAAAGGPVISTYHDWSEGNEHERT
jgi:hypothetical protein